MRIGIDARFWNETGIGRYIRNLVIYIQKSDTKNDYVLFIKPEDENSIKSALNSPRISYRAVNIPWHTLKEQVQFPRLIKKEKIELMHFPYFAVPILYKGSYIVTIHDLILHHFSTGQASTLPFFVYQAKRAAYKIVMKKAADKAEKIIAVSNATKQEIIDHLNVPKEKIDVTYEGFDIGEKSKDIELPKNPYFLHVGNVYPHKNVELLLTAFSKISKNANLLIVGKKDYFMNRLIKFADTHGMNKNVIFLHTVSDDELVSYYKNASGVVVSSFMEGFGLPAVEAMAYGTLVISSDIPSLREVTGGNALFFDPYSKSDLIEKLNLVLNPTQELNDMKKDAKKYVQKYTWEKMAKETVRIYESSTRLR